MSFSITYVACQSVVGNAPIQRVIDLNPVAHRFLGDPFYSDYTVPAGFMGQTLPDLKFDLTLATAGSKASDVYNRWNVPYGRAGLKAYKQFWAWADANTSVDIQFVWDDHPYWNNCDHTLGVANNYFTSAGTSMSSQSDVLHQWKVADAGLKMIEAAYGNNPARGAPNGDIPQAMVGTATGKEYEVKYRYVDWGPNGEKGGKLIREIIPDYTSYKSPIATVTMAAGTPGVVTHNTGNHPFVPGGNEPVYFSNVLGTMPVTKGQTYYVKYINATTYNLSLTPGGAAIAFGANSTQQTVCQYAAKTIFGTTQLNWMKALIADAAKSGFKHIVMSSSKDVANVDNNDGPWAYAHERDALLAWIDTNDYPVIWMCGDKHYPHAAVARKENGHAVDYVAVCACPFGQGLGTLTPYPECNWAYGRSEGTVIGQVYVDTDRGLTSLRILDAWSLDPLFVADVPWGKRVPAAGGIRTATTPPLQPHPVPFRNDGSAGVTASPYTYKNTDSRPQLVTVGGGTVSAIARSRDNSVFDTIGAVTGGDFILAPGDYLKVTYTVAPTIFSIYPM